MKKADNGTEIINRNHSKEMLMDQLQDERFSQKHDRNEDRYTILKIGKLNKFENNLTTNETYNFSEFEVKTKNL